MHAPLEIDAQAVSSFAAFENGSASGVLSKNVPKPGDRELNSASLAGFEQESTKRLWSLKSQRRENSSALIARCPDSDCALLEGFFL
jgi:hypothetical protein